MDVTSYFFRSIELKNIVKAINGIDGTKNSKKNHTHDLIEVVRACYFNEGILNFNS